MGFLITLRTGKNSLFRGLSGPNGIHIPHYWIQDVYLTSCRQLKPAAFDTRKACLCNEKCHPFLNPKISPKCESRWKQLVRGPRLRTGQNWYSVSVRALNLPMPAKYTHVWKPIFSFMFCFEHIGACF